MGRHCRAEQLACTGNQGQLWHRMAPAHSPGAWDWVSEAPQPWILHGQNGEAGKRHLKTRDTTHFPGVLLHHLLYPTLHPELLYSPALPASHLILSLRIHSGAAAGNSSPHLRGLQGWGGRWCPFCHPQSTTSSCDAVANPTTFDI